MLKNMKLAVSTQSYLKIPDAKLIWWCDVLGLLVICALMTAPASLKANWPPAICRLMGDGTHHQLIKWAGERDVVCREALIALCCALAEKRRKYGARSAFVVNRISWAASGRHFTHCAWALAKRADHVQLVALRVGKLGFL